MKNLFRVWLQLDEAKTAISSCEAEIRAYRGGVGLCNLHIDDINKQAYEAITKLQQAVEETIEDLRRIPNK